MCVLMLSDAVLYKRGPPFYHASYSVVVKQVTGDVRPSTLSSTAALSASWTSLAAVNRVTKQAGKVLNCTVVAAGLNKVRKCPTI